MKKTLTGATYSQRLWQRFKKTPSAWWSFRILCFLAFIGVFGDFIANEKPLYCKIDGTHYFPVLNELAAKTGFSKSSLLLDEETEWRDFEYESSIFPLIPYSTTTQDKRNRQFVGPFDNQSVKSMRWRHWFGTDNFGRDVAAGMVSGTQTALLVGFLSMLIASILGIFFGSISGFFGDFGYKISRGSLFFFLLALPIAIFYTFISRKYQWQIAIEEGALMSMIFKSIFIFILPFIIAYLLKFLINKINFFQKEIKLPVDSLVMRLIEVIRSIPGLLLLIAIVSVIKKSSIFNVIIIIGLIRWTGIATFLRSELLKIRELEYIQAAKVLGFSNWRIILRHALPNAITPVLITITFGIASAVLLEAFLSFLGIGIPIEKVTWGSMLNVARQNYSAWWMAVFPGLAIFITVTTLNLVGDGIEKAMSESG